MRLALIFPGLAETDFTWHYVYNISWMRVTRNPSFASLNLTNCSILEMYVGIICACLPSLKALIKSYFPGFFEDYHARLEPGIQSFDVAPPSPQQQPDSSSIFEGQTSTNAGTSVQLKSFATSSEDGGCNKRSSDPSFVSLPLQRPAKALVVDRNTDVVGNHTSIP
jgi:hypothetical protein